MQIDHCLILAAGFGTRMGPIGHKHPKVLWPVFEKSLLELQVLYAKELGVKNIYINIHYMKKEILDFTQTNELFENVTFLIEEPEVLDIGGGIHNLARQKDINYTGKLLVLNADQFFYMSPEKFHQKVDSFSNDPLILFNYIVDPKDGYNSLVCNENREVVELKKNKEIINLSFVETYTGISLIDLSALDKVSGPSNFFDSVCPFKIKKVKAILLDNIDYWDFGTVNRFWKTNFHIIDTAIKNPAHDFIEFLIRNEALDLDKINVRLKSYYAESESVINLSDEYIVIPLEKSILINPKVDLSNLGLESYLIWNDMIEIIPAEFA